MRWVARVRLRLSERFRSNWRLSCVAATPRLRHVARRWLTECALPHTPEIRRALASPGRPGTRLGGAAQRPLSAWRAEGVNSLVLATSGVLGAAVRKRGGWLDIMASTERLRSCLVASNGSERGSQPGCADPFDAGLPRRRVVRTSNRRDSRGGWRWLIRRSTLSC